MNTPITRELAFRVLQTVDAGLTHGAGAPIPGEMCVEAAVCYAMGLPHGDNPPCVSRALRKLKIRLNDCHWSSRETRAQGMRRLAIAQLGTRDVLDDQEFARRVALLVVNRFVPRALRAAASVLSDEYRTPPEAAAARAEAVTELSAAEAALNAAAEAASYATTDAAEAAVYAAADAAEAAEAAVYAAADAASYAAADAAEAAAISAAEAAAISAAEAAAYAAGAASYAAVAAIAEPPSAVRDKQLSLFAEGVVQILIDMGAPGAEFLDLTETP